MSDKSHDENGELSPIEQMHDDYVFTTWSRQNEPTPQEVVDAEGVRYELADGTELLDFSSQLVCTNLGYSADSIGTAMADQAESVPYVKTSHPTESRAKLGKKLAEVTPGDGGKTFFSGAGATAVEGAIKIAQDYTGNEKILSRQRSYHGATFGAMSVTGDPRRHWTKSKIPGMLKAPDAYAYGSTMDPMESLEYIDEMLTLEGGTVAAVLVEPIVGSSGGVIVPPPDYLSELKAIAHDHGALLIADEVMTGFGRTGEWFGCDVFDVEPDILTMAKGLTGSYAQLAATTVTDEIAAYYDENVFAHGHTFSSHPVACAAGLEAIETYERLGLVDRAAEVGAYLEAQLETLADDHPSVGQLRGTGMMYGLELTKRADRREPFVDRMAEFAREDTVLDSVTQSAHDNGVHLFSRFNTIMVTPPLSISRSDIDEGISVLDDALSLADDAMA